MEEKENLIKKLSRIWADFKHAVGKSKIVKGLATTALAAGLAISAAGCEGYKIYIVPDPPADQTQTDDPNKDLNNDQSGNQQNSNGNNNGDNQQNQGTQPGGSTTPTQPDYSQYSQLLQDILKSDYYNDLIAKAEAGELPSKGLADAGNLIDDIPYNFLENQGEDIEAIKNNEARADCYYYTKEEENNTLYGYAQLTYGKGETKNNKIYTIKYNDVSDAELKDFEMLLEGNYYQAGFFIQELDKQNTAVLLNECSIETKSYNELLSAFNNNKFNIASNFASNKVADFIITNITDVDKYSVSMDVELFSVNNNSSIVSSGQIANANFLLDKSLTGCGFKGNVFMLKHTYLVDSLQEISNPTILTFYNYAVNSSKVKDLINKNNK